MANKLVIGVLLLLIVCLLFAQSVMKMEHCTRAGFWRVPPPGVLPLEQGTTFSLWNVIRMCKNYSKNGKITRSFNYNPATGAYQLFEDWLINWTIRSGKGASTYKDGILSPISNVRVTGTINRPGEVAPSECLQKIKAEMRVHGLDGDGKMHANRLDINNSINKRPYKDEMIAKVSNGMIGTHDSWKESMQNGTMDQNNPPGSEYLGSVNDNKSADTGIANLLNSQTTPGAFIGVDSNNKLVQAVPITKCSSSTDCAKQCSWCSVYNKSNTKCKTYSVINSWCDGSLSQKLIKDKYTLADVTYSMQEMCT